MECQWRRWRRRWRSAGYCCYYLLCWPSERVVVGLRVCKQLRRDLIDHCRSMVLVQKADAKLSDCCMSQDLMRSPCNLEIMLKWTQKHAVTRLAKVLSECKTWTHLDLHGNAIRAEGAGVLASVLGECKGLAHLNLRGNRIGVD